MASQAGKIPYENRHFSCQHLKKSLVLSRKIIWPEAEIAAFNNPGLTNTESGELSIALEHTKAALEICQKIGDHHRSAALYNHLKDIYHRSGQEMLVMLNLKTSVEIFGEINDPTSDSKPQIWMLGEW